MKESVMLFTYINWKMIWAGHVVRMEEMRNAYNILVGKPEGKRPLGRPKRRSKNKIRMDLREIGCEGVDWIHLAGCCEHSNETSGSIKGGTFLD
jgi:hypothetical protein